MKKKTVNVPIGIHRITLYKTKLRVTKIALCETNKTNTLILIDFLNKVVSLFQYVCSGAKF